MLINFVVCVLVFYSLFLESLSASYNQVHERFDGNSTKRVSLINGIASVYDYNDASIRIDATIPEFGLSLSFPSYLQFSPWQETNVEISLMASTDQSGEKPPPFFLIKTMVLTHSKRIDSFTIVDVWEFWDSIYSSRRRYYDIPWQFFVGQLHVFPKQLFISFRQWIRYGRYK